MESLGLSSETLFQKNNRRRPRVLMVNDDGPNRNIPAFEATARELSKFCDVTVVIPDSNRSETSFSRLSGELKVKRSAEWENIYGCPTYLTNGMPSDAAGIGIHIGEKAEQPFDLVFSGPNNGWNIGDNVHASGTVAGALQGVLNQYGIRGVAFSFALQHPDVFHDTARTPKKEDDQREIHWKTPTLVATKVVHEIFNAEPDDEFQQMLRDKEIFLNYNVPNLPYDKLPKKHVYADLGPRKFYYTSEGNDEHDEYQEKTYKRGTRSKEADLNVGFKNGKIRGEERPTDLSALRNGYVSCTPLSGNRTDQQALVLLSERSDAHDEPRALGKRLSTTTLGKKDSSQKGKDVSASDHPPLQRSAALPRGNAQAGSSSKPNVENSRTASGRFQLYENLKERIGFPGFRNLIHRNSSSAGRS